MADLIRDREIELQKRFLESSKEYAAELLSLGKVFERDLENKPPTAGQVDEICKRWAILMGDLAVLQVNTHILLDKKVRDAEDKQYHGRWRNLLGSDVAARPLPRPDAVVRGDYTVNVGDKLLCIDRTGSALLEKGRIYEVTWSSRTLVDLKQFPGGSWNKCRFQPVSLTKIRIVFHV